MFKLLFLQDIGSMSVYAAMCACKTCIQSHANVTEADSVTENSGSTCHVNPPATKIKGS